MPAAPILLLDQTDSTNADARRRADAGEAGPLWIVARRQTEGRGRRGRVWDSDVGNLFATLLTTTRRPPAEAAQVTFIAALAVADLLDHWAPPSLVTIKWPNDVILAGEKAAGVLVESGAHVSGGLWLAVGIGVNLIHAPQGTERPATALAHHLRGDVAAAPTVEAAAAKLAEAFDVWMTRWETLGFEPILDAWRARTPGLDGPAVARLGRETVKGRAEGVAADGALKLRLADGSLRLISAGDVFFGEAA
ncbi:MAG: biotin--[acetyl-CoA-carboxylase] ligase [Alphaproteobacteria bacterium]|jgi:BirA family transcriptional regulator, biotin operon repressor / biotin---[acetyl-CoA-carboxylase] ligase|nr:biotin--[acetyl-CoA-carboxylase] ligase [Alphaproteobacteria bacterium]MBU2042720.1 biotin--[acetyl-CoA-carboxylase] ligase [Alphaproteobacteria bacterium]MBU2126157.1 biotin--[acetyl-CoA-carboxylase] ligase [Alphaproteobacteria bacterium]MBU2208877.1 biotin--[acetyl-CoA-carboxylase] ligase [Alphaproteobacteria bacterium]MBU2290392.1 biotin--[acetyl-CoA-carboxylase] ligase [Alphaproteobacteria bacterium]